jgi:hypothetical protein
MSALGAALRVLVLEVWSGFGEALPVKDLLDFLETETIVCYVYEGSLFFFCTTDEVFCYDFTPDSF